MPTTHSIKEESIVLGQQHATSLKKAHEKRLKTSQEYFQDDVYIQDHPLRVTDKKAWAASMNEAYNDEDPRFKADHLCAERFGILIQRDMNAWKANGHGDNIKSEFGLIADRAAKSAFMTSDPSPQQIRFAVSLLKNRTEFGDNLESWKEKEMEPLWAQKTRNQTPLPNSRKNRFYGVLNKLANTITNKLRPASRHTLKPDELKM